MDLTIHSDHLAQMRDALYAAARKSMAEDEGFAARNMAGAVQASPLTRELQQACDRAQVTMGFGGTDWQKVTLRP